MKVDVAMSESVFLTPTDIAKTAYIRIGNTSSKPGLAESLQTVVIPGLQGKGYQIFQKPSQANYFVQVNIRYSGRWKEGMTFEGATMGAGMGALTALGLAHPHHYGGSLVAGGLGSLAGAGIGLALDLATRVETEILVIELQITERLSPQDDLSGKIEEKEEVVTDTRIMGGMGAEPNFPTSKTTSKRVLSTREGTKIYTTGIAARAAKIGLNTEEAVPRLIGIAGNQILGIF